MASARPTPPPRTSPLAEPPARQTLSKLSSEKSDKAQLEHFVTQLLRPQLSEGLQEEFQRFTEEVLKPELRSVSQRLKEVFQDELKQPTALDRPKRPSFALHSEDLTWLQAAAEDSSTPAASKSSGQALRMAPRASVVSALRNEQEPTRRRGIRQTMLRSAAAPTDKVPKRNLLKSMLTFKHVRKGSNTQGTPLLGGEGSGDEMLPTAKMKRCRQAQYLVADSQPIQQLAHNRRATRKWTGGTSLGISELQVSTAPSRSGTLEWRQQQQLQQQQQQQQSRLSVLSTDFSGDDHDEMRSLANGTHPQLPWKEEGQTGDDLVNDDTDDDNANGGAGGAGDGAHGTDGFFTRFGEDSSEEEQGMLSAPPRWWEGSIDDGTELTAGMRPKMDTWVDVVENKCFNVFCSVIVGLNLLALGIQADETMKSVFTLDTWQKIDLVFCVLLVGETWLRVWAYGIRFFFNDQMGWNWFDFVLNAGQIVDQLPLGKSRTFSSAVHLLRILRVVRVLRMCRFITELRILLLVIFGSFRSTLWTLILLFLCSYGFSVAILIAVNDRRFLGLSDEDSYDLDRYFSSLPHTMWTLYLSVSGGATWGDGQGPAPTLRKIVSPVLLPAFGAYICMMIFVFLNIITGIFLNTAIATTENIVHQSMMNQIRRMFMGADDDKSGAVTLEEFKALLGNHELGLYLRGIGWRAEQAEDLFKMLDDDKSGEINIDEFISGCTRLQGQTKAIDFATFVSSFNEMENRLDAHIEFVQSRLRDLGWSDCELPSGPESPRPEVDTPEAGKVTRQFLPKAHSASGAAAVEAAMAVAEGRSSIFARVGASGPRPLLLKYL